MTQQNPHPQTICRVMGGTEQNPAHHAWAEGYAACQEEFLPLLAACGNAWTAIDIVVAMDCSPEAFRRHCLPLLASLGAAIAKSEVKE